MGRQKRVEAQIEEDLGNPEMWTPLADDKEKRPTLGTQVSVRLDAEDAQRLRRVADVQGVGYTSLLREWIRERLRAEDSLLENFTYETSVSVRVGGNPVQVTSRQLQIRDLAVV